MTQTLDLLHLVGGIGDWAIIDMLTICIMYII